MHTCCTHMEDVNYMCMPCRLEPDQRAALGQGQRRGRSPGLGGGGGAVCQGAGAAAAAHHRRGRLLPGRQLRGRLVRSEPVGLGLCSHIPKHNPNLGIKLVSSPVRGWLAAVCLRSSASLPCSGCVMHVQCVVAAEVAETRLVADMGTVCMQCQPCQQWRRRLVAHADGAGLPAQPFWCAGACRSPHVKDLRGLGFMVSALENACRQDRTSCLTMPVCSRMPQPACEGRESAVKPLPPSLIFTTWHYLCMISRYKFALTVT